MGTMADDGAMPRRASGNGGVVGSSITRGGQSGSWLQSKMNVRRIVNQFLLSTDERKKLTGLPPTFDSITADQACNEKLYEELAFYLETCASAARARTRASTSRWALRSTT
jgi:hypothetical protein